MTRVYGMNYTVKTNMQDSRIHCGMSLRNRRSLLVEAISRHGGRLIRREMRALPTATANIVKAMIVKTPALIVMGKACFNEKPIRKFD